MPTRSRSRSYSRGRRVRSRSASDWMVGPRSLSRASRGTQTRRVRPRVRISGAHKFSRFCNATEATVNGTFLSGNIVTSFNQMVQSSDFSGLFDQYRINKVVLFINIVNNPDAGQWVNSATAVNQSNWYPKIWYIPDYDGGSTETLSSIRERQGVRCRFLKPNSVVKISFTPRCRVLAYSTSTATGYSPKNIKIDMTDTNVEHYGLNYVIDMQGVDVTDTQPYVVRIERKLYFTCYGVR